MGDPVALFDMDYFFAQCEELRNPGLSDKPVAVCIFTMGEKGAVSSANYVARRLGIRAGMPCSRVKDLSPEAVLIKADPDYYKSVSSRIMNIILKEFEKVEVASIDEAYAEVKDYSEDAISHVKAVKDEILSKVGIKCSVGIGSNKLIAKIACELAKPNGFLVIYDEEIDKVLKGLSPDEIPFIGKSTQRKLREMGVRTVEDAQSIPIEVLQKEFGEKKGLMIYEFLRGIDRRPLNPFRKRKELIKFITLNGRDPHDVVEQIADGILERLGNRAFRRVGVVLIYRGATSSKRKSLATWTSDRDYLISVLKELLDEALSEQPGETPRRVGGFVEDLREVKEKGLMDYL